MSHPKTSAVLFATIFPQTVVSMLVLAPPIMAEQITTTLGLSPAVTGAFTGLVYVFVLATNSQAAPLIGRFGALRLSFGCVAFAGLGLALLASGNLAAMVLATAIIGLGYGPLTPASSQVLARQAGSASLAFIVSVRQTSVPLGGVLAGLVVPRLVLQLGWQQACLVLGLGVALLGLALAPSLRLVREEKASGVGQSSRGLLAPVLFVTGRPSLLALSCASFIFGALQLILSSFLVVHLVRTGGRDLVTAGVHLGVSQVAGVVGRLVWGYIADRMTSPRKLLAAIAALTAIAALLMGFVSADWPGFLTLLVAALFGATASGWNGVYLAEIMREVEPAEVGLATSGSLMFTYFGIVLGPPMFGATAALVGFEGAFVGAAIAVLVGAVIVYPRSRRVRPESAA